MVDLATVAGRVYGMLFRPQATLAYHGQPAPPWRVVAREHALPLIVANAVVHGLLLWLFRPFFAEYGFVIPGGLELMVGAALRVAFQFAGLALMAGFAGFFAGALGGRNDFDAAYVLVALAMTPAFVTSAFAPIPGLGLVLWIAGFLYAMIILYRGAPSIIGVPPENRGKHLALTLASTLLAGFVAVLVLGPLMTGLLGTAG